MPAAQVTRNFTIAMGNQTISFGPLADQSILASPVTVSATATSGLPVAFASNSLAICTVSGTSVTLLSTGTCSITASQAGDADWNAAAPTITQAFQVSLATSTTVVTCPASVEYDGSAQEPCTVSVTGAGGLGLTPTPIYTLNTDVGTATASYTFAGDANHSGSTDSATFDITAAASTTVVTCPASVEYDGSAQEPCTVSVTGAGGLSLTPTPIYTLNTDVGTATASYTFAGDANHSGSTDSATFDITAAASTTVVEFEPGSKTFRGSAFTASAMVDGPGGLHQPVSVVMSGNCVDVTVPNGCTATATFPGNGNHSGSSDTQSITIVPASQVISFATVADTTTDTPEVELVASADSSLAVTFTSLTPSVCDGVRFDRDHPGGRDLHGRGRAGRRREPRCGGSGHPELRDRGRRRLRAGPRLRRRPRLGHRRRERRGSGSAGHEPVRFVAAHDGWIDPADRAHRRD